jgi:hypothetical protein
MWDMKHSFRLGSELTFRKTDYLAWPENEGVGPAVAKAVEVLAVCIRTEKRRGLAQQARLRDWLGVRPQLQFHPGKDEAPRFVLICAARVHVLLREE